MTRIGLLSDTHGYWDDKFVYYFSDCDEIWHIGDIGSEEVANRLLKLKPLRAVYGNIDGYPLRTFYAKILRFKIEETKVLLTHIGGYPGKYNSEVLREIITDSPRLLVCGHSHILKIIYDKYWQMLCINPGAAGKYGRHTVRTIMRFSIDSAVICNMEIVELRES